MNYDCTLILEKDRKAYNASRKEKERREGMEDGVFDVPGDPILEIWIVCTVPPFLKPIKNHQVKYVRISQINQNKCIIYTTQNAKKIVILLLLKMTLWETKLNLV